MKKIINDSSQVVSDMIAGLVASRPWVERLGDSNCVVARPTETKKGKVALISLGGSGHEPADAGYIGLRGLDGVACGHVFSSPSADQIYETAKATHTNAGVLLIVKNYTGDRLNARIAQEMLADEGIETASVLIADDVAVEDSTFTTGRRGIVGTIFAFHFAGVAAETGLSLTELKSRLDDTVSRVRSAGVSLSSCTIPSVGKPSFSIGDDEMEWFMGIHGEPGIRRGKAATSREIAEGILDRIHADLPFASGQRCGLIVNGCGGTPLMELYILADDALRYLNDRGVVATRVMVGNYMTSLEMQGASISVLRLRDEAEERILATPSCVFHSY